MPTDAAQGSATERISGPMMLVVEQALEEISTYFKFILFIYLLTSVAGVFNAWHILVSNFYAFVPPYWCKVPELEAAGWSPQQIRAVSAINDTEGSSCFVAGWNYTLFVELGYKKSLDVISNSTSQPDKTPCKQFYYDEAVPFSTVVSEWNLVCDKKLQKSNVQGSIAIGKFVGGLFCGFLADMYGRKPIFLTCSIIYFVSGVGSALTDSFWVFLITRFWTGIAGAGCYESGFTLLAEFVGNKHRAALGCMYNMGYPVGHITLPILSLMFLNWRHLQLVISLPLVMFLLHFWLLPESPRWLLVHGQPEKALKVIRRFIGKNYEGVLSQNMQEAAQKVSEPVMKYLGSASETIEEYIPGFSGQAKKVAESSLPEVQRAIQSSLTPEAKISFLGELMNELKSVFLLFSTCELSKRISISMFNFVTAALVYYVLALNARNFKLDQHMYTFVAGWVGIPGYAFPLLVMVCMGRKCASSLLFLSSGLPLVIIAFIPIDQKYAILTMAMVGRFTNVAVFALVTVYCAELFPTIVRNSAIGVSLATSQLGSIYAPYIVDLVGPYGWYLPSTICGIQTILASLLILLLPETKGKSFLNTLEDVENQPDKVSLRNCCKFT